MVGKKADQKAVRLVDQKAAQMAGVRAAQTAVQTVVLKVARTAA